VYPTGYTERFVINPIFCRVTQVLHRTPKKFSDKFAYGLVKLSRWAFDFASGYTAKPIPPGSNMSIEELRKGKYILDEKQWLSVRGSV
jgi:ubiquinol oxidase